MHLLLLGWKVDKCSDTVKEFAAIKSISVKYTVTLQVKHPPDSSTDLHPEVYGEKGWTFLKFSSSYYTKAEEYFCKALELQPDDWEWNTGYAIVLYRTEQVQSISQSAFRFSI